MGEATPSRLIWSETGPWRLTIVYRDEVPHNFPKPHTDLLEQFAAYRVPPDKTDEVAKFDGSVLVERTKGEVSARCDMKEMNYLALNLMHEIVNGKRSVEEARKFYAETAAGFSLGRRSPYTQGLLFRGPDRETADVDETMIAGAMLRQSAKKVGDLLTGDAIAAEQKTTNLA